MYMSAMRRCSGSTKGVFMAERLFGTDGLRGTVNNAPMTVDVALRLGLAAGVRFRRGPHQHKVVIGKDTRLSGYMFESALTAGLCAAGMHVIMTGPLPTPAISFLTRSMRADLGVVISASHNPFSDNGIKFFDADGYKLPDQTENEIAEMVLNPDMAWPYPDPRQVGRATKIEDAGGRYIVYTKSCFPTQLTLSGLRIVVDCANGASYKVAPLALEELGAEVFRLSTAPDGTNINDHCGSLYPEVVAAKVREVRADVGLALDGDADRLIVVDEHGNVLDGDQLMALCAQSMMARGELPGNMLVATVMSNLALEIFMREHGGTLLRTKVGDDLMFGGVPGIGQLIEVAMAEKMPVIGVMEVPWEKVSRYGIIDGEEVAPGVFRVRNMVEKPKREAAPSRMAIVGRYVLTPEIFDYLEKAQPGHGGEIQLTDALQAMAQDRGMMAVRMSGMRFDAGDWAEFLTANIYFALQDEELRYELLGLLKNFVQFQ